MAEYASEMRLYDPETQERLYLDAGERERFLEAADRLESRKHCLLCEVVHWTGCRISEALELTPRRIDVEKRVIRYRTIKKRKYTRQGELKAPVFRDVPISKELARSLDMCFGVRKARKDRKGLDNPLWHNKSDPKRPVARTTGWRIIKRALDAAKIEGPQATAKGLRHGYAVAMILGGMEVRILKDRLGHESADTTAIYLQVVGEEAHKLDGDAWKKANESWV
ncbi:MAG: integrase [gamma proteobacterium symbiont of Ctena orbiculata]|nr:MAG: integrase [gamma proteobacterium symbiont of Ctena orbiculata]